VYAEKLRDDLMRNKFNSSTTIYYMLIKRSERSQNYKRKFQLELGLGSKKR
jgi:hypothetical protein